MMSGTRHTGPGWILCWRFALLGLFLSACQLAVANEPTRGRVEFDRADVPADLPAAWPKEIDRLTPVERQEFESLIEQINSRNRTPRPAWLKSAHYEATLVNETLQSGQMTASVQRRGTRASMLELGQFSFAMKDLRWQNRPAIWGSSRDGRVWLVADGENQELLGEWSCRGRAFPGGIDFDLRLPLATTSFLDLRIPRKYKVTSNVGEVNLLSDVSTEETRLWRILCGSENHCRITLVSLDGLDASRRAIFVEQDMQVAVREEELRFQLNLFLEALDAPVQDLILKVPAGTEIHSAVYGADTPIPIQRTAEAKADGRIAIHLPGPLSGRRRTLHIDGSADHKPGQPVVIPNVMVEDSTFDGGHLAVSVQAPMEIRSIRSHGYRQRTADSGQRTSEIESMTFQQLAADAQLILDVHRAPISLSGQSLTILEVEEDSWNITSEIVWTSLTGRAYRTSCQWPSKWEIIDVAMVPDTEWRQLKGSGEDVSLPRDTSKLNWDVQSQSGGTSLLTVEFLEPIQLGQSRAVKVVARRRPPSPGQPVPVPLPQLLNCDVSEMLLGIQLPAAMNPVVSPDSQLERTVRPTSSLFKLPPQHSNSELRWYRQESVDITGTLELRSRLLPVNVKARTVVEALPAEYRVKYSIHYEQREPQVDRLLVYLTEPSPEIRWSWKGAPSIDLTAVKLSKSSHVEWNLPSRGELWEIRLPRTTGPMATIEGGTASRWTNHSRPALLFVPQAVEKTAELRLTQPESLELNLDTNGLKPTGQRQSWLYATPQAELGLTLRNPEPSHEFPLMVSMQLRTLMSADRDGFDVYRARLQLENGSAQESLRIKFDSSATIQEAFVGGESIVITVQGDEIVIPGLNAARRDVVELHYRVPADSCTLYQRRRIVVPKLSAHVLGFHWEFSIPPTTRIYAEPTGVRLTRSIPSPAWHERLFGPLGRTTSEAIFNPLRLDSWIQFLSPRHSALNYRDSDGELVAIHQAIASTTPDELSIELWHAARIQLLTWISFGLCLSLGIIVRLVGWRYRDRLAAYWLSITIAAVISAQPPFLGFLGGAIAGTLIALLIPRHLLRRRTWDDETKIMMHPNPSGAVIVALSIGVSVIAASLLLTRSSDAQETGEENTARRPMVYVPVDENGLPSETIPLVYVPGDALARWRTMAAEQSADPTYLISSARYQLDSSTDDYINLAVRYRVHVLVPMRNPVTISLGLSDLSLPDAESCQVNGTPYPISVLPSGKGYAIELSKPSSTLPDLPTTETEKEDDLHQNSTIEITSFDIDLRSRKPRPQAHTLDLKIPPVAHSQFQFTSVEPVPFIEVGGSRGLTERVNQGRTMISDLGSTSSVQVRWSQSDSPHRAARLNASLLQNLELHASYAELFFHLSASISSGSLDSLELDLPPNAAVRRIQSRNDDLLRTDVIVAKGGQRRLRLVFIRPQQSSLTIDGSVVLLQQDSLVQVPLPKFGVANTDMLDCQYSRNWWGVSTAADFRLEAPNLEPDAANTVSPEAYLNAWTEPGESRRAESMITRQPQFTFEFREGMTPSFTLTPFQPRRKAIQWRQIGVIGKRRLNWTLVGEIEITQAPTFQTALLVDRRLRVEKISVKENGAERRNRWTESRTDPSRVVLFLSDKSQGKQTITLQGSIPITPGSPIQFPSIRPEDCETTESRLILMHDPEVEVAFEPPADWKSIPSDDVPPDVPRSESAILLGAYQINDLFLQQKFQTSSRHSRCTSRASIILSRLEGASWLMNYRLEMTPVGESPLRMGLKFPAAAADLNSVSVERAEPVWQEIHDGYRQLDLLLNRNESSSTVSVQFEIPLTEPKLPDWILPLPIPMLSNNHETVIAIAPESLWSPNVGTEVRASNLPDWCSHFMDELTGDTTAFRTPDASIELHRDVTTNDFRDSMVRLLDQKMWLHHNRRYSGITQAFISSPRHDIVFGVPHRLTITSIFLDDQPLALNNPVDELLVVPVLEMGTESILTISWETTGETSDLIGLASENLIWPQQIRVKKNLFTFLPESPTRLWNRTGLIAMTSLDQNLDRLDTLLERHAGLDNDSKAATVNRWLIHQIQSRLVARLPAEVERPTEAVRERLNRWERITEEINQLEPVPPAPPLSWQMRLLEGPVTDSDAALRGRTDRPAQFQFWQFNEQLLMYGVSFIMALVLIPVCRRVIRLEWSRWLHQHVAISWLMLALFWWLFLTPSVFGPLLLALGVIRTLLQSRPAPYSPDSQASTA